MDPKSLGVGLIGPDAWAMSRTTEPAAATAAPPDDHDNNEADDADDDDDDNDNNEADEVLTRLQALHQQLSQVRQDARERHKAEKELGRARLLHEPNKLVVCAVKRPVRLEKTRGGEAWRYLPARGGLKSGVDSLVERGLCRVQWVSWPGRAVDKSSQEGVRKRLETEHAVAPVFLSAELEEAFYRNFCHGVLWPLLHCLPTEFDAARLETFNALYDAYLQARFVGTTTNTTNTTNTKNTKNNTNTTRTSR